MKVKKYSIRAVDQHWRGSLTRVPAAENSNSNTTRGSPANRMRLRPIITIFHSAKNWRWKIPSKNRAVGHANKSMKWLNDTGQIASKIHSMESSIVRQGLNSTPHLKLSTSSKHGADNILDRTVGRGGETGSKALTDLPPPPQNELFWETRTLLQWS